jgi:hypothetical protein
MAEKCGVLLRQNSTSCKKEDAKKNKWMKVGKRIY